jgi:hypothetical protein
MSGEFQLERAVSRFLGLIDSDACLPAEANDFRETVIEMRRLNWRSANGRSHYFRVLSRSSFFQRSSDFSYCSVVRPFSGYHRLKP